MNDLVSRDLDTIWHPYTQMKTADKPIPIVKGEGVYLYTQDGTKLIDAVSSWWVNIHGHSHPYIAQKVFEQLKVLEHVIFAGFTHPQAVKLAENLLSIIPKNQAKIFYSDNGSTAVEVAIKMCLQFWSNQGQNRTKILAFKNSYHGDTFGAMAVSARSAFTKAFDALLFDVEFIDLPNKENLEELKAQISEIKSELACFIFEPLIQGAGGMLMYEAEDLDQILAHCKEEKVLTIADEVMTGFGRTGKLFASDHLLHKADLMCFSKGLTGGTMPLGITSCSQAIYDAFLSDDKLKTLFHGHSFTANPVACAASNASFDILMSPESQENLKRITKKHQSFKKEIEGHPKLRNVRQCGTIIAMDWDIEATSYFNNIRNTLYNFFLEKGIILRPLGNILYIMPPYCISDADLDYIYDQIREALTKF
ncbi:adenosylmethionine--8-amino-7-oxononanoate transaminase [Pedobacter sp. SD-b]|uniref:Adenosylmethionine-8-amino-7-oxononanoate aminotransferase n=1 Tax=Pedobacter segetis TaxID=2793069 RepID=A0ABS1BLV7_9SPHI|nr:adenosylmethionine--8-amino-7-oxononanoate transaminase [Pedobacter segetis]MBK0383879.1 adenosylmethionine--8-amino-7-oxononanoate transaminase [Pedobacter segetis]